MANDNQYEWVINEIAQNQFDDRPWDNDQAFYMWKLHQKGQEWFTSSGMDYSDVKLLMKRYKVDHPSDLTGKTFISKYSDASSALNLLVVEIKSNGKYDPPAPKDIRLMAAKALAEMELPDYSMIDSHAIYEAFAEIWKGFDPQKGWLAWFIHEIYILSNKTVALEAADPDLFSCRVKGPAAYMTLSDGKTTKRVILGPYSSPVQFDFDGK